MKPKPTHRHFWMILLALLTACTPAQPNETEVLNTAIAIAKTSIPLTQVAISTVTPTATIVHPTPSPFPTRPPFIPIMTPDVVQVANWQEYQTELAKFVLSANGEDIFPFYESVLCEWDILGRSNQEVYVWAVCSGPSAGGNRPAVIYLEPNGAIQKVAVVQVRSSPNGYSSNESELFPPDVQKNIGSYYIEQYPFLSDRALELIRHLHYRETHPEEPPLVVLSAMPIETPVP